MKKILLLIAVTTSALTILSCKEGLDVDEEKSSEVSSSNLEGKTWSLYKKTYYLNDKTVCEENGLFYDYDLASFGESSRIESLYFNDGYVTIKMEAKREDGSNISFLYPYTIQNGEICILKDMSGSPYRMKVSKINKQELVIDFKQLNKQSREGNLIGDFKGIPIYHYYHYNTYSPAMSSSGFFYYSDNGDKVSCDIHAHAYENNIGFFESLAKKDLSSVTEEEKAVLLGNNSIYWKHVSDESELLGLIDILNDIWCGNKYSSLRKKLTDAFEISDKQSRLILFGFIYDYIKGGFRFPTTAMEYFPSYYTYVTGLYVSGWGWESGEVTVESAIDIFIEGIDKQKLESQQYNGDYSKLDDYLYLDYTKWMYNDLVDNYGFDAANYGIYWRCWKYIMDHRIDTIDYFYDDHYAWHFKAQ